MEELALAAEHLDFSAPSMRSRLPGFGDLLARIWASASCAPTGARSAPRPPPLSLLPNRRACMTRVSLNTSRSPGRNRAGRSAIARSASCRLHHQQAAGGALGQRCLGDQLVGAG
jgi:hypothetical protein